MSSDATLLPWIRQLHAEVPFAATVYGSAEPPANAADLAERLAAAYRTLDETVALAAVSPSSPSLGDPEWFVALADHLLPLLCWSVGLGAGTAAHDAPKRVTLVDRAKRLQQSLSHLTEGRAGDPADAARDTPEPFDGRSVMLQHAAMLGWRAQLAATLHPLVDPAHGAVRVSFELPTPGMRVADLAPPPVAGSPTHGTIARVLVPAVRVRLDRPRSGADAVEFTRGAVVR